MHCELMNMAPVEHTAVQNVLKLLQLPMLRDLSESAV